MSEYVLVESRDGLINSGVTGTINMASDLRQRGYQVTLFLRREGVPCDNSSIVSQRIQEVSASGVTVDGVLLKDDTITISNSQTTGAMIGVTNGGVYTGTGLIHSTI